MDAPRCLRPGGREEPHSDHPRRVDEAAPAGRPTGRPSPFSASAATEPDRARTGTLRDRGEARGRHRGSSRQPPRERQRTARLEPGRNGIAYPLGDEDKYFAYNLDRLAIVPAAGGAPRGADRRLSIARCHAELVAGRPGDLLPGRGRSRAVRRAGAGERRNDRGAHQRAARRPRLSREPTAASRCWPRRRRRRPRSTRSRTGSCVSCRAERRVAGKVQLATVEDFTSKSKDGTMVHGLLIKPAAFTRARTSDAAPYPRRTQRPGRPRVRFRARVLRGQRLVVLEVNYRGSNGRGAKRSEGDLADWGDWKSLDCWGRWTTRCAGDRRPGPPRPRRMELRRHPDRTTRSPAIAIQGGGQRRDAARCRPRCTGSTSTSCSTKRSWACRGRTRTPGLKVSYPFFHADRITTPTLFLCGEKDFNVPIPASSRCTRRSQPGVDTQLVIYPGSSTASTMPSYQRDRLQRYVAWYNTYLKPKAATPTYLRRFGGGGGGGGGAMKDEAFDCAVLKPADFRARAMPGGALAGLCGSVLPRYEVNVGAGTESGSTCIIAEVVGFPLCGLDW